MALHIIDILFQIYTLMIIARIFGSWVPEWQQYRAMQFVTYYTDPYLNIFRRIIPPLGMIDISPIIAFLALGFIKQILQSAVISFL